MQDLLSMLNALYRPKLLMRAARIGAETYRRTAHLPRLLGYGSLPRHGSAIVQLMEMEATLNTQRLEGDAAYGLLPHVDILIALVGEARLLRASYIQDPSVQAPPVQVRSGRGLTVPDAAQAPGPTCQIT